MTDLLDSLFGFEMPDHVVPPEDCDAAVSLLPDDQFPYGSACVLARGWQAVLFHYGIKPEVAVILMQQDITSKKHVRYADPDGQEDSRLLFNEVCAGVSSALQRLLLKRAFRRMLLPDPFAAIIATPASSSSAASSAAAPAPPAKKVKVTATPAAPDASAVAVVPVQANKRKDHDISDSDSETDSDVPCGGGAANAESDSNDDGGAKVKVDSGRSQKRDLASLFDSVDNEVRTVVYLLVRSARCVYVRACVLSRRCFLAKLCLVSLSHSSLF